MSSVNHAPPFGGVFRGKLEIKLVDGSGSEIMNRVLDSSMVHARPSNMSWTPLDSVHLERSLVGQLILSARVVAADTGFSGVRTRVHLRRRQYDPGMGGMVNYVMLGPGILFLIVATGIGANMAGRGWDAGPVRVTIVLAVILGIIGLALRGG